MSIRGFHGVVAMVCVAGCGGGDSDRRGTEPPAESSDDGGGDGDGGADANVTDARLTDAKADAKASRDASPASDASNPPPDAGDPCDGVVCPAGQACVSSAHGEPLGVCVQTCDCSNCPNCDYTAQDGRWNDQQEYCGNLNHSPATMACNVPCTGGGEGCIYYGAVNVCWPLEGCFSL